MKNKKTNKPLVVPKYAWGGNDNKVPGVNQEGFDGLNTSQVWSNRSEQVQNDAPKSNAGASYGSRFGMSLASGLPQIASTFNNPNATTGDKVGATVNTVSNAAIGTIPGFGQMYGPIRGAGSMVQGFVPGETKYDRNTGQVIEVKKSGTAGEKVGAVVDSAFTPFHEQATESWKQAADAKDTKHKVAYSFKGIGDMLGFTSIPRMFASASGKNEEAALPNEADLSNVKPNSEYQSQLQFGNYKNGGNLESYSLAAHSQLNKDFANTHLDGNPVQIEKNETILRKENGGDYVFSDNPKMKNPLTGNTFAKDSKKIESQTAKPFYDKASEATKKFQLENLQKINDNERNKVEGKMNGGISKYANGGNKPMVADEDYPELVDFSQRPELEVLSMQSQGMNNLNTNQGLLPLSGIQGNFNKLPETRAGSNWGNGIENRDTLTTGDKLQLAGILPGTIYNTVRAFQKPENQKLYTDKSPITQQAIAKNLNPAYLAYNAGREGVNNATSSDAVRRASLAQMTSNLQKNVMDYSLNVDNQNKGLRTQFEDRLANQNRFNIGQKVMTDDTNSRNKAAQRAFGAAAATNLGQGMTNVGQALNQGKTNEIGYSALQNMAANYGLDPKEYADFLKGKGIKIKYNS